MIEKFNGILFLIVFVVHFIGYAVYAFRCVFGTQSFLDQYAMDATGAIMTVKLMEEMERSDTNIGLVTMCVGGGQGVATVFERLN